MAETEHLTRDEFRAFGGSKVVMYRTALLNEGAEEVAALAVKATFAPLVGSISLIGARVAVGSAPAACSGSVRALPDEIRGISDTVRALADFGEAVSQVGVRICDARGSDIGAIDFTWRLTSKR